MGINRLQPSNKSTNSFDDFRTKKLQEYGFPDPDISNRHSVIIEYNLEIIEQLQNLLNQILEVTEEGLETKSLDEKNKALQIIKDTITQSQIMIDLELD